MHRVRTTMTVVCDVDVGRCGRADAARSAAGSTTGPAAARGDAGAAPPSRWRRHPLRWPSPLRRGRARRDRLCRRPRPAMKIETPNKSTMKLGLLLQPQFQASQPRFGTPAAGAHQLRQQPLHPPHAHPARRQPVRPARLLRRHRLPEPVPRPERHDDGRDGNDGDELGQEHAGDEHPGRVHHVQGDGRPAQDRRRLHAAAARAQRGSGRNHALHVGLLLLHVPQRQRFGSSSRQHPGRT